MAAVFSLSAAATLHGKNRYQPQASLSDPTIDKLVTFAWEHKVSDYFKLKADASSGFAECMARFGGVGEGGPVPCPLQYSRLVLCRAHS